MAFPSLLALCTARLCQEASSSSALDELEPVFAYLPLYTRQALFSVLHRSGRLSSAALRTLNDGAQLLDVHESSMSDAEAACLGSALLLAMDCRRCSRLTGAGLHSLLAASPNLHTLRLGGCPTSDRAASSVIPALLPRLSAHEAEECWGDALPAEPNCPRLRWLVWPEADLRSRRLIARHCPRITLLPSPAAASPAPLACTCEAPACECEASEQYCTQATRAPARLAPPLPLKPPPEADLAVALNACFLAAAEGSQGTSTLSLPRSAPPPPNLGSSGPTLAQRFLLAYLSRDCRLAPKREKNRRQAERRAARGAPAPAGSAPELGRGSLALRGAGGGLLRSAAADTALH